MCTSFEEEAYAHAKEVAEITRIVNVNEYLSQVLANI